MLEARARAGGAAARARVEAEGAGGITPLARQGLGGERLADGVEGAHVAHRVGARGLADGGLVHQLYGGEVLVPTHGAVAARGLQRPAVELAQGVVQHVLHQGGLTRAADARDAYQPIEGDAHVDALQVVLGSAQNLQVRRRQRASRLGARGHGLFAGEVLGGARAFGLEQLGRGAEEHLLAAALARAGTQVQDAVGGQHHLRVVLHHDQGVAGIAQAVQHADDALHVAGMQADAGLVQDEQGIDQRSAQGGGQVDALHLAAGQGARLAVQGKIR